MFSFFQIRLELPFCGCFNSFPDTEPCCNYCGKLKNENSEAIKSRFLKDSDINLTEETPSISNFLETSLQDDCLVQDDVLIKYATVFDIIDYKSISSCCFTKGYSTYVQGTGSILHSNTDVSLDDVFRQLSTVPKKNPQYLELLRSLKLRYFTPREISNLMCFPKSFSFPKSCSKKQAYKCLGNSINVYVVSLLLTLIINFL